MKSKCEEKLMGPMFPRLHVNDTEKGGPRAPPRNKMALYEKLSIPSQRFKHGVSNNPKNANCKGNGCERDVFSPLQLPPSRHPVEKPHSFISNSKTPSLPVESNKKTEEDDFRVPVFINSKLGQGNGKFYSTLDGRKLSASTAILSGHSRKDFNDHVRDVDDGDSSLLVKDVASKEQIIPNNNHSNDTESKEDKASESLQTKIVDQGDDLSETSMVESISGMYISPDDVVGIIGQKHFWNARRAIANQQRAFAVQVFELHRLIKVQRLIAGSPSMLEDSAYVGNTVKDSSARRLTLEYIVRDGHNVSKQRKDSEKPNVRMECSAENTVGKTSLSYVQNSSQPSSYNPFSGRPIENNSTMGPWSFNRPSRHQWLIPVMTPSEGLVYKPYAGPGGTSPICVGYGPPGSTPIIGNFSAPPYGVPTSNHHYQGVRMPFAPPYGNVYFSPYGMPTVDQSNQFVAQGLQNQLSGKGANFYIQRQNSSNVSCNKNGTVPDVKSQASTTSSPSGTTNRIVVDNATKGRNVLPLFPTSPDTENSDSSPQPHIPSHPARVIKVVPRNARSATESAARIFQSIQDERKQYDSDFTHL